jgi:hypothetical protein
VGNLIRLCSSLYKLSGSIGGACDVPVGYTSLVCLLIEGNTSFGVGGLLYLKVVSGLRE